MGGLIIGIILILIGLSALTGISFFGFIFAIILIAIGVRIIVRGYSRGEWRTHGHQGNAAGSSGELSVDEVAIFSGLNKSFTAEHFKGGKIVMVFSGGQVDLTGVTTDLTEIDFEVSSVFSNITIIIPKDWKVRSVANAFMGGVDIHEAQGGDGSVTLTIRGDAAFGDIEVKK